MRGLLWISGALKSGMIGCRTKIGIELFFVSIIVIQAGLDVWSTLHALSLGYSEGNPSIAMILMPPIDTYSILIAVAFLVIQNTAYYIGVILLLVIALRLARQSRFIGLARVTRGTGIATSIGANGWMNNTLFLAFGIALLPVSRFLVLGVSLLAAAFWLLKNWWTVRR